MDPTLAVASRQSETLQRAGSTVIIFVISLFGMYDPLLVFLTCLVRLTRAASSRIVSLYLCPRLSRFTPTYIILRWQALWNGSHFVNRVRPSSPRFLQIAQQPPRSGDIESRGLDGANSVNALARLWVNELILEPQARFSPDHIPHRVYAHIPFGLFAAHLSPQTSLLHTSHDWIQGTSITTGMHMIWKHLFLHIPHIHTTLVNTLHTPSPTNALPL